MVYTLKRSIMALFAIAFLSTFPAIRVSASDDNIINFHDEGYTDNLIPDEWDEDARYWPDMDRLKHAAGSTGRLPWFTHYVDSLNDSSVMTVWEADQIEKTSSNKIGYYTCPQDGYYLIELTGGTASSCGLSCSETLLGEGGRGAVFKGLAYLNAGTVIGYELGSGGAPSIYMASFSCDHDGSGHIVFSYPGEASNLWIDGELIATANGGGAAFRACVGNDDYHEWYKAMSNAISNGENEVNGWDHDDCAVGGSGGEVVCYSLNRFASVQCTNGANGHANRGFNRMENREGTLALQDWWLLVNGDCRVSRPGGITITYVHEHTWISGGGSASCLEAGGTINDVCSTCGAIRYGTVVQQSPTGHAWQAVPVGTEGMEVHSGDVYYNSSDAFEAGTSAWYGADGYYFTKVCANCAEHKADPQPGYYTLRYNLRDYTTEVGVTSDVTLAYCDLHNLRDTTTSLISKHGYLLDGYNGYDVTSAMWQPIGALVTQLTAPNTVFNVWCHWKPIRYNIVYQPNAPDERINNGSAESYDYDQEFYLRGDNAASKPGYSLIGWRYESTDYGTSALVCNLTDVDGATCVLYPRWQMNSYTVRYHNDQNNSYVDQTDCLYAGTYVSYLNGVNMNFTKPGYYIAYWKTADNSCFLAADPLHESENSGVKSTFSGLSVEANGIVDVYPVWVPINYYVQWLPGERNAQGNSVFGTRQYSVPNPEFYDGNTTTCNSTLGDVTAHTSSVKRGFARNIMAVRYTYGETYSVPFNPYSESGSFQGWTTIPNSYTGTIRPGTSFSNATIERNQVITVYTAVDQYPELTITPPQRYSYQSDIIQSLLGQTSTSSISGTALEEVLIADCVTHAHDREDGNDVDVFISNFSKDEIGKIDRPTLMTITFTVRDHLNQCTNVTTTWEIYSGGKVNILVR